MHEYTMNKIGEFIKENYCPENMTKCDLNELYLWSKSFKDILEGDYYYHVIEAMENSTDEDTIEKLNQYSDEFQKYYTAKRDMDLIKGRMYYSSMTDTNCGISQSSRCEYLNHADDDKDIKMKYLEKYALDLMSDITEMLDTGKASQEEKIALKQWLAQYVNKM